MSKFAKLQLFILRNSKTTVEWKKYTELQRVVTVFDASSSHNTSNFYLFFILHNQFTIKLGSCFTHIYEQILLFYCYNFIGVWLFLIAMCFFAKLRNSMFAPEWKSFWIIVSRALNCSCVCPIYIFIRST